MQSNNALSNLKSRYRAILKKCNLLNTFGSLAVASAFVALTANTLLAASTQLDDIAAQNVFGNHESLEFRGTATTAVVQDGSSLTLTGSGNLIIKSDGNLGGITLGDNTTLTLDNSWGGDIGDLSLTDSATSNIVFSDTDVYEFERVSLNNSTLNIAEANYPSGGTSMSSLVGKGTINYTNGELNIDNKITNEAEGITVNTSKLELFGIEEGASVYINTEIFAAFEAISLAEDSSITSTASYDELYNVILGAPLILQDSASFTANVITVPDLNVFATSANANLDLGVLGFADFINGFQSAEALFVGRENRATDVNGFAIAQVDGFISIENSGVLIELQPDIEVIEDGVLVLGNVSTNIVAENNKAIAYIGAVQENLYASRGTLASSSLISSFNLANGGLNVGSSVGLAANTLSLGSSAVLVADVTDVVPKTVTNGVVGTETAGADELQSLIINATNVDIHTNTAIKLYDSDGLQDSTAYTLISDITNFTQDGQTVSDIEATLSAIEQNSGNYITEVDLLLDGTNLEALITKKEVEQVFPAVKPSIGLTIANYTGGNAFFDLLLDPNNTTSVEEAQEYLTRGISSDGANGAVPFINQTVNLTSGITVDRSTSRNIFFLANADNSSGMPAGSQAGIEMVESGFGMWALPMYQYSTLDNLDSAGLTYSYDSEIYGISGGLDYTFANNLRVGAAFHMGKGQASSSFTHNDIDYIGTGLYAGYIYENFTLSADIAYIDSANSVEQRNVGGSLFSDYHAQSFSTGIRAEYIYSIKNFDIIPNLGFRYSYSTTDDYRTKLWGSAVFDNESVHSSVYTIPIGIAAAASFDVGNGFKFKPSASIGVKFAFGDLDMQQTVHAYGSTLPIYLDTELYDSVTYQGALGLSLVRDDLTLSFDYTIEASKSMTSHNVHALFRYNF